MAVGDWTTLANVKITMRIKGSDDDALLALLITQASATLSNDVGRVISSQSYTDVIDGSGQTICTLENSPLISVQSVTIDDVVIPANADPLQAGYKFDQFSVFLTGYEFNRGLRNVIIQYTAGFATTPADLERCCIETVDWMYHAHDRSGVVSRTVAGETFQFDTKNPWPASVDNILDNYRRVVILR